MAKAMSFRAANADFEDWLRHQCDVVEPDLEFKHERMKKNAFVFLRATFFRWAQQIERLCPDLKDAPKVLAVGDTHTENFGTWRDAEGRLVWGINDFDEAVTTAYPYDLVRLATSVRLAPEARVGNRETAEAIIAGYREGLEQPRPALLDEQNSAMRPFVACTDQDRQDFWIEVDGYPKASPPAKVRSLLEGSLPKNASVPRFASRVKGGGGLGRPRYVAIATWCGGRIVREAKAIVPSAWSWAHGEGTAPVRAVDLAFGKFRAPDPHMSVKDGFIVRRIAADSRKVELGDAAGAKLRTDLLSAMGFDIAAIHAATNGAALRISRDLKSRDAGWLHAAAKTAAAAVTADFEEWRSPTAS
jgi:uncharacterized protein DUF2252